MKYKHAEGAPSMYPSCVTCLRFASILTVSAAFGVALLLTACGGDGAPGGTTEQEANAGAMLVARAEEGTPTGERLEGLYAERLHSSIEAAVAGTAYIEIEGERLKFSGIECKITERDDGEALRFNVKGETTRGTTELSVLRGIGWGVGFDYEEELVQVTHLTDTDGRDLDSVDISMAQNSADEAGVKRWHRGNGPDPMFRIVGANVTAIGTLSGHRGSDNPQEGNFVLAANCDEAASELARSENVGSSP
ncbi:MAG: hypothetical protein WD396_10005 [Pseudohongiellaceae bacterium]